MFNGIPFLSSPFPWVFLASVALGMAVSRATTSTAKKKEPERAKAWKWTFFCLYLSAAFLLALAAVFIPGPSKLLDVRLLWLALATAGVTFFAFRFKKAVGIPVVLLAAALVIMTGLFLQSVHAFTGETEIAKVRVISANASAMKLELVPASGEPEMLSMEGDYFAPIVKVVIFNDFWVFLGSKTWYRFEGITSFREVDENGRLTLHQGNTDYYFPKPSGISDSLFRYMEKNEGRIPGIKAVQISLDGKRAREFSSYSIRVENDGGVEIVPLGDSAQGDAAGAGAAPQP